MLRILGRILGNLALKIIIAENFQSDISFSVFGTCSRIDLREIDQVGD